MDSRDWGFAFFVCALILSYFVSRYTIQRKHKRLLLRLARLLDEPLVEPKVSGWESKLEGQFRGRRAQFQIETRIFREAPPPPQFQIKLSCNSIAEFPIRRGGRYRLEPELYVLPAEVRKVVESFPLWDYVHDLELRFGAEGEAAQVLELTHKWNRKEYLDVANVRATLEAMDTLARTIERYYSPESSDAVPKPI